jgi:hypothetical protein
LFGSRIAPALLAREGCALECDADDPVLELRALELCEADPPEL